MESENIVRNIVQEIIREGKKGGVIVDQHFCSFYVKLLILNPNWKISDNILRIRSDVQKFIKYVVGKLENVQDPKMLALKIQFYFDTRFDYLTDLAKVHRKNIETMLQPLKLSILEPPLSDKRDLEKIFERVVNYITLAAGLGNPQVKKVYVEAETVLRSVWSWEELKQFSNLLYTIRLEKLNKLIKVVAGIRLYNMDCKRGGQGIHNLPILLSNAIGAVRSRIKDTDEAITSKADLLSDVINSCYRPNNTKYKITMDYTIPSYSSKKELDYCVDLLLIYKQYSVELRKLLGKLDKIKFNATSREKNYNDILNLLHLKVVPNMHIRASDIFPLFEKLYTCWSHFQDETVLLTGLKDIFENQNVLVNELEFENNLVKNFYRRTNEILHMTAREFERPIDENIEIVKKDYAGFWSSRQVQYAGHCCWTLVLTKGVLSAGNEKFGVVIYKSKFYLFSSPLAIESFARDPEYYILRVLDLARKNCELIIFLHLSEDLVEFQDKKQIIEDEYECIEKRDVAVGTELDWALSYQKGYESNIWNLKRYALQLATLMRSTTSSTQTGRFNIHESTGTQIWPLKDQSVQTKSDNYTSLPPTINYIYGLRGRRDDKQLDLKVPCSSEPIKGYYDNKSTNES